MESCHGISHSDDPQNLPLKNILSISLAKLKICTKLTQTNHGLPANDNISENEDVQ